MASPYRPTVANSMTGSSVSKGFAGGHHELANPKIGASFHAPHDHGTVTPKTTVAAVHPITAAHVIHPSRGF